MRAPSLLLFSLAMLPACSAAAPNQDASGSAPFAVRESLFVSSKPADGSTVTAPVDELELEFAKPVRLQEVTVTGADGLKMPIMVTAVGEVIRYSVPLDGLGAGSYTVEWKANSSGVDYNGNIHFDVK